MRRDQHHDETNSVTAVAGLPLFAEPAPARAVDTSRAAAVAVEPRRRTLCDQVLGLIRAAGRLGLTRNELHDLTGISIQTLCGRLYELEGKPYRDGAAHQDPAGPDGALGRP